MTTMFTGPTDVRPTQSILGIGYTLFATSAQTGGSYELMQFVAPPGAGPPPHFHKNEDESFYIVDGEFEVFLGGETRRLSAGDFVHLPRGVPHAFRNVGTTTGRFLCYVVPGNLEGFFAMFARDWAANESNPPPVTEEDIGNLMAAAAKYEVTILPPPSAQ